MFTVTEATFIYIYYFQNFITKFGEVAQFVGQTFSAILFSIFWAGYDIMKKEMLPVEKSFTETFERLEKLHSKMQDGFEKLNDLIKKEPELNNYPTESRVIYNIFDIYKKLFHNPPYNDTVFMQAIYEELTKDCNISHPERAINWFHEKLVGNKATQINMLWFFINSKDFENDSSFLANVLSAFS